MGTHNENEKFRQSPRSNANLTRGKTVEILDSRLENYAYGLVLG